MKKNKTILWKWGISYLCLFLIPLTSICINYYHNKKSLEAEYMNAFDLISNNLSNAANNCTTAMNNYMNYILSNDSFQSLRFNTTEDNDFHYNTFQFQNSLALYTRANTSLGCTVYYNNLDFISSQACSNNIKNYYQRLKLTNSYIPSYDEWSFFVTSKYNNDFLLASYLDSSGAPCLIMAHTINRNDKYCTIFIEEPLEDLIELLSLLPEETFFAIQSTDQELHILDENGQFVTSSQISLNSENILTLPENYISITKTPQNQGFTCHLIISDQALKLCLYHVRKNFFLTLTITLFLGFSGAIVLLYTNYQPVSRLLNKFNIDRTGNNEFISIATTYDKLLKDYQNTHKTIQHQKQALTNSQLLSLIKGRIRETDIQTNEAFTHLRSNTTIAMVGFSLPPSDKINLEYDNLLFFAVDNIFCELFDQYTFHRIDDGCFIYYLFELREKENWQDIALEKVNYLCNLLKETWNTTITCAVSTPIENLMSCRFLYREIMESFEQQKIAGGTNIIDTRFLDNWHISDQALDLIEQELTETVKEGDLEMAIHASQRIFSVICRMPFSTQKFYLFNAFTQLLEIYNNYISNPMQQAKALDYLFPLMQVSELKELQNNFNKILTFFCNEISQKCHSESNELIVIIQNYIEQNYTDPDLSVSSIADALGRNPSYLSRVFKNTTGEGLLDYINRYRITKARNLMQQNQYTITEISELVGYPNTRTFRRAFTKLLGELPSKYNK